MVNSGVYEIFNTNNGKRYIGSSQDIDKRFETHRRRLTKGNHRNPHLQNAFNKYGESVFEFRKLIYCDVQNVLIFEQMLMDGLNPEYNISPTAGSTLGLRPSRETRKKMSKAKKGKKFSKEHKRKISLALQGHKPTLLHHKEETKNKISDSLMGHEIPEDTKDKIRRSNKGKHFGHDNGMYGKEHTEEAKQKIRMRRLGKAHSKETKNKISHALKGRKLSEEHKKRISKALKEYHKSTDSNNKTKE